MYYGNMVIAKCLPIVNEFSKSLKVKRPCVTNVGSLCIIHVIFSLSPISTNMHTYQLK